MWRKNEELAASKERQAAGVSEDPESESMVDGMKRSFLENLKVILLARTAACHLTQM